MYHHSALDLTAEEFRPVVLSTRVGEISIDLGTWLALWMTDQQARELVAELCEVIPALFPDGTKPWPDR